MSHSCLFDCVSFLNLSKILLLSLAEKSIIRRILSKAGLSLYYFHKLPDVFEYTPLYYIKLYIDIDTSMSLALSICALFISFMQLANRAQFLKIIFFVSIIWDCCCSRIWNFYSYFVYMHHYSHINVNLAVNV